MTEPKPSGEKVKPESSGKPRKTYTLSPEMREARDRKALLASLLYDSGIKTPEDLRKLTPEVIDALITKVGAGEVIVKRRKTPTKKFPAEVKLPEKPEFRPEEEPEFEVLPEVVPGVRVSEEPEEVVKGEYDKSKFLISHDELEALNKRYSELNRRVTEGLEKSVAAYEAGAGDDVAADLLDKADELLVKFNSVNLYAAKYVSLPEFEGILDEVESTVKAVEERQSGKVRPEESGTPKLRPEGWKSPISSVIKEGEPFVAHKIRGKFEMSEVTDVLRKELPGEIDAIFTEYDRETGRTPDEDLLKLRKEFARSWTRKLEGLQLNSEDREIAFWGKSEGFARIAAYPSEEDRKAQFVKSLLIGFSDGRHPPGYRIHAEKLSKFSSGLISGDIEEGRKQMADYFIPRVEKAIGKIMDRYYAGEVVPERKFVHVKWESEEYPHPSREGKTAFKEQPFFRSGDVYIGKTISDEGSGKRRTLKYGFDTVLPEGTKLDARVNAYGRPVRKSFIVDPLAPNGLSEIPRPEGE